MSEDVKSLVNHADAGGPVAAPATPAAVKMVGAVTSAVKILRYLSKVREPLGVTRIAKDTRINPSTCFNILRTLAAEDLIQFNVINKTYTISLGIMDIAQGATAIGSEIESVRPQMLHIARTHGLTMTLWQPIGHNRKVLILSALTHNAIRIQMAIGQRLPMLIGATGRCFAAFSGFTLEEERRRFEVVRWDRPISFEEFHAQVEETARRGWAIDEGHFAEGTVSLAVPILDDGGRAVLAATATMFSGQFEAEKAEQIIRDMQELARRLKRIAPGS